MKRQHTVIALMILFICFPAKSAWLTKVDDDLFSGGKQASMFGVVDGGLIIFECTESDLSLAFAEESSVEIPPSMYEIGIRMLFKIDDLPTNEFMGRASRRNVRYMDIKTNDKGYILEVLKQLQTAKRKVLAGIEIKQIDSRHSTSGDVINSTKSVNSFIDACKIDLSTEISGVSYSIGELKKMLVNGVSPTTELDEVLPIRNLDFYQCKKNGYETSVEFKDDMVSMVSINNDTKFSYKLFGTRSVLSVTCNKDDNTVNTEILKYK